MQIFTITVTLRASCVTVYCNRSCLFVGGWMCSWWVCYHDNSKLRAWAESKIFDPPQTPSRGRRTAKI